MKQISWPLKANWINTLSIVPRCCHFWCKQKKIGLVVLPADRVRISWKLFWALWSSSPSCVHLRLTRATECWWSFLTSAKTRREKSGTSAMPDYIMQGLSTLPFSSSCQPKLSLLYVCATNTLCSSSHIFISFLYRVLLSKHILCGLVCLVGFML